MQEKKEYAEAVNQYSDILECCLECFGPDHPWTAKTYENLGTVHEK